jgi:hypothetical protein
MTLTNLAERKIKALQKEFLAWVEAHPILHELPPEEFNDLRRRVFRGTFEAYRLGVIGTTGQADSLSDFFMGWLGSEAVGNLAADHRIDVSNKCFSTALEAYRIGVMVALSKKSEDLYGMSI